MVRTAAQNIRCSDAGRELETCKRGGEAAFCSTAGRDLNACRFRYPRPPCDVCPPRPPGGGGGGGGGGTAGTGAGDGNIIDVTVEDPNDYESDADEPFPPGSGPGSGGQLVPYIPPGGELVPYPGSPIENQLGIVDPPPGYYDPPPVETPLGPYDPPPGYYDPPPIGPPPPLRLPPVAPSPPLLPPEETDDAGEVVVGPAPPPPVDQLGNPAPVMVDPTTGAGFYILNGSPFEPYITGPPGTPTLPYGPNDGAGILTNALPYYGPLNAPPNYYPGPFAQVQPYPAPAPYYPPAVPNSPLPYPGSPIEQQLGYPPGTLSPIPPGVLPGAMPPGTLPADTYNQIIEYINNLRRIDARQAYARYPPTYPPYPYGIGANASLPPPGTQFAGLDSNGNPIYISDNPRIPRTPMPDLNPRPTNIQRLNGSTPPGFGNAVINPSDTSPDPNEASVEAQAAANAAYFGRLGSPNGSPFALIPRYSPDGTFIDYVPSFTQGDSPFGGGVADLAAGFGTQVPSSNQNLPQFPTFGFPPPGAQPVPALPPGVDFLPPTFPYPTRSTGPAPGFPNVARTNNAIPQFPSGSNSGFDILAPSTDVLTGTRRPAETDINPRPTNIPRR